MIIHIVMDLRFVYHCYLFLRHPAVQCLGTSEEKQAGDCLNDKNSLVVFGSVFSNQENEYSCWISIQLSHAYTYQGFTAWVGSSEQD